MVQQEYYTIDSFDLDSPVETVIDDQNNVSYTPKPSKHFKFMNRSPKGPRAKSDLLTATADDSTVIYDTLCFELPDYFTESAFTGKAVELQYIHLLQYSVNDKEWYYVPSTMHSDLVQFRPSADSYVCATNVMYTWTKRFVIPRNMPSFDLWFRDMNGTIINMDPTITRVIVELLLTY